jgi:hypothetical protein
MLTDLKVIVPQASGKTGPRVTDLKVIVPQASGKTGPRVTDLQAVLARVGQISAKMVFVLLLEEVDREVARVLKEVRDKTVRVAAV